MGINKGTLLGGAGIGVLGAYAYKNINNVAQDAITDIVSGVVGTVDYVLDNSTEIINNAMEPVVGAAAPFAFPMLAGAYAGKKLADIIEVESGWKRNLVSTVGIGVGAAAGAVASTSAIAPLLTVAGAGWTGKKLYNLIKK